MLRRLAGGGMGEVYLAAASGPAGFVKHAVVKRILPHYAEDPDFVAMFVNEARLAAALDHPNIVRVYDFGEAQGNFFYAMEYLHGDSLAALLPKIFRSGERLELGHALTIGLGLSAGLHFAHEWRGPDGKLLEVVHRDVSPANVFLTVEGEVKLLDFGIAKVLSTTSVPREGTREGTRKGKVPYMSPEQCVGEPLDRRSDVFALGILLYEMTTMSRLFRADNEFATMNMITSGVIPPPSRRVSGYPPALAQVVMKALCRDRDGRYASALELHEALEQVGAELGLRSSALALGRLVRRMIDDRPYPAIEPAAAVDEPQTAVFFAALNEALTQRGVSGPPAGGDEPTRRIEPAASPPPGGEASIGRTRLAPVSSPGVAGEPGPRRRRLPLIVTLAGAGALVLVLAWQTSSRSASSPGTTPTLAVDDAAREPAPIVATPPIVPPPIVASPAVPPVQPSVDPPVTKPATSPATRITRTTRKKPVKKANVLDSLRPSK